MSTRARRGTTLVELVVALAIMAVFLYMAVSIAGSALARTAAQREVLGVQGAFRSACDAIVQDARRASWPNNASGSSPVNRPYTGPVGSNPYIAVPLSGSMDSQLAVTLPIDGVMHVYRYYLASSDGAQYVARADYLLTNSMGVTDPFAWTNNGSDLTLKSVDPITSPLNQLTHIYFTNQGGTVTLMFVAEMRSGGVHQVTYCSNLFVRNYLDTAP